MLKGKSRHRHRLDQRHRAGHRPRARRAGREPHAERLRRRGARSSGCARGLGGRVQGQGRLQRRRHVEAGADPRDGRAARAASSARSTSSSTTPASSTPRRSRSFPDERWDAVIAINLSSTFHAIKAALPQMKPAQLGAHHQHRLGARPGRLGAEDRLRRGQARRGRPDQGGRARNRANRHHLQRDLPGLGADAAGAEADRRARREGGHRGRAAPSWTCSRRSSPRSSSPRRSRSARWRCSCAPRRPRRSAARRCPIDGGWSAQ